MVERIALVLLCAVVLEFLGNFALHRWQNRELVSAEQTRRIAEQLVDAVQVASAASPEKRAMLMHRLDIDGLALNWVPRTVLTDSTSSLPHLAALRGRLVGLGPELARHEMRLNVLPAQDGGERDLIGAIRLEDGSFISFRVTRYLNAPPRLAIIVLLHVLLIAAVFAIALAMVKALVQPLDDLARAADETGRNQAAPIAIAGPHEVRRVAGAFAAMQSRLLQTMEDNTRALIGVSHDLRTPIQRLRLRAGLLRDEADREPIVSDLKEMERFIDSTLAYVRSGLDEPPRLLDVAALISTLVDDAAEAGATIDFTGPDSLLLSVRPTALRRLLYNLIDNSRKYAGRTRITLTGRDREEADILVEDDGPGIPADLRMKVLQPFARFDVPEATGRSEEKGVGLGLAFVQRTVETHKGTLALSSSAMGGLAVRITLPDAPEGDIAVTAA